MIAWSYSRLYTYRECPRKFRYKYLDKLPEPEAAPLVRGQQVHERFERAVKPYAKGARPAALPAEFKHCRPHLKLIKTHGGVAERELAFDAKWRPVDWFSRDAWLRVKIDVTYYYPTPDVLKVADYKTGRIRPEANEEQVRLYVLATLLAPVGEPPESITSEVWFVDHEPIPRPMATVARDSFRRFLAEERADWERKSRPLTRDKGFHPTPGRACTFCPFSHRRTLPDGRPGPCGAAP